MRFVTASKKKPAVVIISLLVAFSVLVPFIFLACNVFHRCDNDGCAVCTNISSLTLSQKKSTLYLSVFFIAAVLLLFCISAAAGILKGISRGGSPIMLKVRMND